MREKLLFLRSYLRHPYTVSSIIPTSKHTLKTIAAMIDGSKRRVIMEYGPGTGGLAKMLLADGKLTPDSKLILIEKVPGLADYLKATINDPRCSIVCDSAENADHILHEHQEEHVDYVLCSAPLTIFPEQLRTTILQKTKAILRDDGTCIVYLFRTRIKQYLKEVFIQVTSQRAWWNIPPLIVCRARKQAA